MRLFFYNFYVLFFVSCSFLSSNKDDKLNEINYIVDYTKIDASPSFKQCNDSIGNKRANCFKRYLYEIIKKELKKTPIFSENEINQNIYLVLQISKKGKIKLKKIKYSKSLDNEIPNLKSLIKSSIELLPVVKPALKRGIPVTIKYILPINIKTKKDAN